MTFHSTPPGHRCLYVKIMWCRGIPEIYGQLEERALVYVHSAICETDFM